MVTDPIADFLTQVRNAARVGKEEVLAPFSRMKQDLAEILKREGFIREVEVLENDRKPRLRLLMKTSGKNPAIRGIKRVSTPGRRVYKGSQELPHVLGGLGVAVISTSSGVMTDSEARRKNVGGEILCHIW